MAQYQVDLYPYQNILYPNTQFIHTFWYIVTCNECWDQYSTCEWNAESTAWNECSQVWDEGSGYAPFNQQCIEEQSQTAVQCYANAGCFEAGNQDCWWKIWDLGCSPYQCEAYTICYENLKNEAGCDQQLQTCEQDCDYDSS